MLDIVLLVKNTKTNSIVSLTFRILQMVNAYPNPNLKYILFVTTSILAVFFFKANNIRFILISLSSTIPSLSTLFHISNVESNRRLPFSPVSLIMFVLSIQVNRNEERGMENVNC